MTLPAPTTPPTTSASLLKTLPTYTAIFDALADHFGLTSRPSQLTLAEKVRGAVSGSGVLCAEAPTGTGKTLAYLAGALDAQAHAGTPIPIVVATATVGLQEQILRHDIPRLVAAGVLDPRTVCVAKGRGRYFCPRTAALLEDKKMRDGQHDMFQTDKHVAEGGTAIAIDMLKSWREKKWDGDKDSWPGTIPACWEASCGASSDTCVGRACDHFESCPYMQSRQKLAHSKLIIANHDIVLADLAQRSGEQTNTVLPPKHYALIVDESHRFPDKAIATKKASVSLTDTEWLRQMEAYSEATFSVGKVAKMLTRQAEFNEDIFSVGAAKLAKFMEDFAKSIRKSCKLNAMGVHSWGLKPPVDAIREEALQMVGLVHALHSGFKSAISAYSSLAEEASGAEKGFAIRMLAQTHTYMRKVEDLYKGLELFSAGDNLVRWVSEHKDGALRINTQPLEGNEVLTELLWQREMPVVLVSATLQIAGSFERYRSKCGLPAHARTETLPPVFDYSRGFLHQPKMECDPSDPGYETEVTRKLELLFKAEIGVGMLVLFTSRESMRRVARMMPEHMADLALIQDQRPVPELVQEHRTRIDAGGRSILFGLDSMAEGLDLPGKYLSHVVIVRLPFAVPGDPVEEARRDLLQRKWFEHAYLADMLTTLIQAAGRLIRRETDHGVITLLDKRLHTKRYAFKAFEALPGFTRITKIAEYRSMAATRGFDMTHGRAPKPKPALVAVAKAPVTDVVAKPAPRPAPPPPPVKVDPMAPIWQLTKKLTPAGAPVTCTLDTLMAAILQSNPVVTEDLCACNTPCLPVGTPVFMWAERKMPQAWLLGIVIRNQPWSPKRPFWARLLSLRPDLFQYAQILRSHHHNLVDDRKAVIAAADCESILTHGLAKAGFPGIELVIEEVNRIEAIAVETLSNPFMVPSKELMQAMPGVAMALKA